MFASFVEDQEAVKVSLEGRANDVLKGIGAVITVLVAVAALAGTDVDGALNGWERWLVAGALVGLLLASVLALVVLVPRRYESLKYKFFDDVLTRDGFVEHWRNPDPRRADITRFRFAEANLLLAKKARDVNQTKAKLLVWSLGCAFSGIAALAFALAFGIT